MKIKMKMLPKYIIILIGTIFFLGLMSCQTNSLKDIDGNVYKTVTIGTQVWMAENLRTTKYNDGTPILNITGNSELSEPSYYWYDNDATTNKETYGALYNWYVVNAANDGGKNVCPTGWHIPTVAEWTTLITYLGGESVAGGKLKETGTIHWNSPNAGATNESGFTALPSGNHLSDGKCYDIGRHGYWWSSALDTAAGDYIRHMYCGSKDVVTFSGNKKAGFSVRCLKDK